LLLYATSLYILVQEEAEPLKKDWSIVIIEPIHKDGIDILKKAGRVIQLSPGSTRKNLLRVSRKADAFITRGFVRIPREVLAAAEKLKVIGVHGVGVDHIDMDFAAERGIQIVRTPTALTDTVAEFTIGLMLSLLRKIPLADVAVRTGEWSRKYRELVGVDLIGKTVGIIGLGRIGSAVARRLKTFDVHLIYYRRTRIRELEKKLNIEHVPLDELLGASDIISIHVPLTPETYHMIAQREFDLMTRGVYLVNTSRGAVIDEKALYLALMQGKVAGAALDVFEFEPLNLETPLLKCSNVILTPHIAVNSKEALRRMAINVATKVIRILNDKIEITSLP
jgi:D-3-phosphoglycerate dehydrogenase